MDLDRIKRRIANGHYDQPKVTEAMANRLLECGICHGMRQLGEPCHNCYPRLCVLPDDGVEPESRWAGLVAGVALVCLLALAAALVVFGAF